VARSEPRWSKPVRARQLQQICGYSHPCHLVNSGESLSALWIARYPDSGNERKRVLGVARAL
jgi:hypothetical protein